MTAKRKKIVSVVLIVVVALAAIGGAIAGIWFGVNNDKYTGYVRDAATGEPIAGVSVTNGRDVVKTDENGYYALDGWLKDRFVTVTIPSGYWTEDYYRDKDSENYDFTLEKLDTDMTDHSFLQVADSEVGAGGVGAWIDNVKDAVDSQQPAFIIHTGDICYEDGLRTHIEGMNTENMGVPVRYAIGNHDYIDRGGYGEAYFESIYGPVCYSFEVGDVHYIVTPMVSGGDHRARYGYNNVWKWVANDVANTDPDKKIVMFNHNYCPDEDGFVLKYGIGGELDLKEHGLIAWIFGHWHYNYMYETNGVFNICTGKPDSGNIDSTEAAVRGVFIAGGELTSSKLYYYEFDEGSPEDRSTWSTALDGRGGFAEPIVSDGYVYAATVDDGWPKTCGIYKVNASDGSVEWKYDTANSVRNSMALSGGRLLAQDVTGRVYCIDADSGEKLWEKDTGLSAARNTALNVLVDGDKVYCGGAQKSVCLALSDGSLVWETENDRANSAPGRMIIDENRLLVGSHWDELIAYDKNTGRREWDIDSDNLRNRTATPVISGGRLYVAAIDAVMELDRESGKVLRRAVFEGVNFDTATRPYVSDGRIYFATANSGVIAIDEDTFEEVRKFDDIGGALIANSPYVAPGAKDVESSIVEVGGNLCFGASDGFVYAISKEGSLVGRFDVGSPVLSMPAVCGDGVVVLDFSGNLTMIPVSAL